MENQKKTKEVSLDEIVIDEIPVEEVPVEEISLAEAMAEEERKSEETVMEEIILEETSEEETSEDEIPVEEVSEDEISAEKPAEEVSAEETMEEPPTEKKGLKISKTAKIIIAAVLAVLVVAYLGVAMYFSDRFLMGTTVNGVECTGKTVDDVKDMLQSQVENYVLTLEKVDGETEVIKGVDIGIKYNGVDIIEGAFAKQNSYAWIASLFHENNIEAEIDFEYDSAKLDEVIGQLACMQAENQVAPVSAIPVFVNGTYEIQEEVYGTQIQSEQLYAAVHSSVDAMESTMNLEEKDCYVLPIYTKDSNEVVAAKDELNKYLGANITYSLDGITVTVDQAMIQNWISVDQNMTVAINAEQVRAFTDTLGTSYNTPNRDGEITTPTGKVAAVPNAILGRVVGSAAECEQLINEIKSGKTITREPLFSQQATPEGSTSWGTTYIEVDITAQHMWYIVNGAVAFECDVVTGSPGRDTPVGSFTILEKLRNKVLRGNIMPNGKREYETPVSYWARVTWSGIGFHDATWQPAFGGELYKQGAGSHGCINMPLASVAAFYEMISVGCPVIIHY